MTMRSVPTYKALRLVDPAFAREQGIAAESPVFASPIIVNRESCHWCGGSFGPLLYGVGRAVESLHRCKGIFHVHSEAQAVAASDRAVIVRGEERCERAGEEAVDVISCDQLPRFTPAVVTRPCAWHHSVHTVTRKFELEECAARVWRCYRLHGWTSLTRYSLLRHDLFPMCEAAIAAVEARPRLVERRLTASPWVMELRNGLPLFTVQPVTAFNYIPDRSNHE